MVPGNEIAAMEGDAETSEGSSELVGLCPCDYGGKALGGVVEEDERGRR